MNDQATINEQIAEALGDARGSYEQLIGAHICTALGLDPAFRGQLIACPSVSTTTATWLRDAANAAAPDAQHATEILTALQL